MSDPIVGHRYEHYRGGPEVDVLHFCTLEQTPAVAYRHVGDEQVWVRSVEHFKAKERLGNGTFVERFRDIGVVVTVDPEILKREQTITQQRQQIDALLRDLDARSKQLDDAKAHERDGYRKLEEYAVVLTDNLGSFRGTDTLVNAVKALAAAHTEALRELDALKNPPAIVAGTPTSVDTTGEQAYPGASS